jgi:hypothetical protein
MFDPAIGKVTMRATVEWFKKEELHRYTLTQYTIAVLGRILYTSGPRKNAGPEVNLRTNPR